MKTAIYLICLFSLVFFLSGCGKGKSGRGIVEISGHPALQVVCKGKTFASKDGKTVKLGVPPGTYNFRISAPGHYPRFSSVVVKAGQTCKLKVELEPVVSAILIDSTPRGAKVEFNGQVRGATPLVIADLPAGEYSAQLKLRGYAEETVGWKIFSERPHPRLHVPLKLIAGQVKIDSKPGSAKVFINGDLMGTTPYTAALDAGVYRIRVEREGFNPKEKHVTVVGGKTVSEMIRLDTRPGSLRIESVPSGAEVFIEDKKVGTTPYRASALEPGNYHIRVASVGYDDAIKIVSVAPSQEENVQFSLDKSTGSAVFKIRPAGVNYLVDGKFCGKVRGVGKSVTETQQTVIENLSPGEHVLTVTHSRAKPLRRDIRFTVSKGKRYVARDTVTLWVSNCEITFKDGRVEAGMILSESETDIYYSPARGIEYPVSRTYIRQIKYLPVTGK